ncbi:hypothetical protein DM558_04430 [Entomomonas moraniae]|uniref:Uncharacterized protein n=1 Tax=Entomomonas moraniae TaxID=2213226 RepID=A0A3S9XCB9_9GAMM|nr:hypothetical protein DM558_04430 [Entomomonas moraniae]
MSESERTVQSTINCYAPSNKNNTQGYIQRACTKLGVQSDEPIKLTDAVFYRLVKAIYGVENGNDYTNYYPREAIEQSIGLAKR